MRAIRSSLATALLVALGVLGGAAAIAAEQTPDEVLKSRGLEAPERATSSRRNPNSSRKRPSSSPLTGS